MYLTSLILRNLALVVLTQSLCFAKKNVNARDAGHDMAESLYYM